MISLKKLALCALLSHAAISHAAVSVSGDVLKSVSVSYKPGMRLLDVISLAKPNPESYWLAAAWLHEPEVEKQTRLKVGVLFDLKMLQRGALLNNNHGLAAVAEHLHQDISQLPVTGRKVVNLDPVALEVGFAHNYLVSDGDKVTYPVRTNNVSVVGAVEHDCTLPYQPLQQVRDYLDSCPRLKEAESDFLWLIHPDGTFKRIAIAAWNREDGIYAVAGSKILVPVRNDNADLPTPDLNEQLAQFLATQPLAEVAP